MTKQRQWYREQMISLYSPHPPEVCVRKLSEVIDKERYLGFDYGGRKPVVGEIHKREFRIWKRGLHRNAGPNLQGRFEGFSRGTLIVGDFDLSEETKLFTGAVQWMVILVMVAAVGTGREGYDKGLAVLAVGLFFLLARLSTSHLWPWLLRKDRDYLVRFLQELLDASPASLGSPERL